MLFQNGRSRWMGLDGPVQQAQPIAGQLVAEEVSNVFAPITGKPYEPSLAAAPSFNRVLVKTQDDGPNSDYLRCFYKEIQQPLLCEKVAGCCNNGCCPKDTLWLGGLWVLVAFVLIIMVVGLALAIVCYQRSKNKNKKPILPNTYYAGSQYTYGSDFDENSKYSAPY